MPSTIFRIKIPYPLQWGAPTFDAGHSFGMMAAVLVSLIEVTIIDMCLVEELTLQLNQTALFLCIVDRGLQGCSSTSECYTTACSRAQSRHRLAGLLLELFFSSLDVHAFNIYWKSFDQGIGILLDGLFGTCTGSTVSV